MSAIATKLQPVYLAGKWVDSPSQLEVRNPYNDELIATTYYATPEQLEYATAAAERAMSTLGKLGTWERAAILSELAARIRRDRDDIARIIALEAGKPIRDAETEVDRGIFTVETAAEEAKRIDGEVIPLDLLPSSKGRLGIVRRFPIGPIAGISPFNFPLNLALHKLAPAIASGNSIVLKPPSSDPLTMLRIASLLEGLGLPDGAVSVLPMNREVGDAMVSDERYKLLSFTGSPDVGWAMKNRAGKKKVVLELGGNAGVLIDADADLAYAANRIRIGAFAYAGQVCISVQRIFIHERRYEEFLGLLLEETAKIVAGDPLDRSTDMGPMIDDKAAQRTQRWVNEAADAGARILAGGNARDRFFEPTVIEGAPKSSAVCAKEAFAPLVNVFPVTSLDEGIDALNDSEFGLQAGVFTGSLEHSMRAFERIEAGGVTINDIPTYRIDHMPYGGVKSSGLGREGVKYTIEDMTEPRLMVINRPG
jgi:glyceraldehyde-3-phosphate dehydrogenase (NADP+)